MQSVRTCAVETHFLILCFFFRQNSFGNVTLGSISITIFAENLGLEWNKWCRKNRHKQMPARVKRAMSCRFPRPLSPLACAETTIFQSMLLDFVSCVRKCCLSWFALQIFGKFTMSKAHCLWSDTPWAGEFEQFGGSNAKNNGLEGHRHFH